MIPMIFTTHKPKIASAHESQKIPTNLPEIHGILQDYIAATGVSLGGMACWLLAAADPRIFAAAPAIGVQSFHHALVNAAGTTMG